MLGMALIYVPRGLGVLVSFIGTQQFDLAILRVGENVLMRGLPDCRFAPFDIGFLDYEMSLMGREDRMSDHCTVLDTLEMARDLRGAVQSLMDQHDETHAHAQLPFDIRPKISSCRQLIYRSDHSHQRSGCSSNSLL